MKNSLIIMLLNLVVAFSFSQTKTEVYPTNINHKGVSLGVTSFNDGLIYARKDGKTKQVDVYNLFYASKEDSVTFNLKKEDKLDNVNIAFNNGSPSVYENELYYTANSGLDADYTKKNFTDYTVSKEGENTLQIFISKKDEKGEWQFPTYATFSNIEHNFTTPFISKDGSKLYFSSDRPGGFGGYDLYVSERQDDNSWGEPKNLGPYINSAFNDVYPFVYDNKLYFSSKINNDSPTNFYYSVNSNGSWEKREELTDLNSEFDDFGISFETATTGYFSSNRGENQAEDKTFYFRLAPQKEEPVIAVVTETPKEVIENIVEEKKEEVPQVVSKPKLVLSKVIYFDLNGYRIKSEGRFELDKIAYKLENNSNLIIEILGYTDASGANEMNLSLSQKRAKAVKDYLVDKNIDVTKITEVKGFGENNLINDCADYSKCGEEANALNRRVEIKVLEVIK